MYCNNPIPWFLRALTTASGTDTDAYHYGMLDHDYESDTEHADFRQYSSAQGRWMSPDPYGGSYDPSNPQSMNRYAYASNNPLSFIDPLGLDDGDGGTDGSGSGIVWDSDNQCFDQYYTSGGNLYISGCLDGGGIDAGDVILNASVGGAPSNAFGVTPQQKKDCLNAWSNSGLGKGVQFFSLYNLATNFKNAWKEWTLLPGLKLLSLSGLKAMSNALEGGEVVSVTGGTVTTLGGTAASGIATAESAGAAAAPYGIGAATILDMNASAGCMGMQSNYFSSGQVGVF